MKHKLYSQNSTDQIKVSFDKAQCNTVVVLRAYKLLEQVLLANCRSLHSRSSICLYIILIVPSVKKAE